MNILHIIGFLGADPEERFTPGGQKLWVMRVATRTRKNGQEETIWWRITVWGDQYDKMISYLKKGKPVYVIGEMNKLDIYTDKNGQPQVSYEATAKSLHFLPHNERPGQDGQPSQGQNYPSQSQQSSYGGMPSNSGQDFSQGGEPSRGGSQEMSGFSEEESVPF